MLLLLLILLSIWGAFQLESVQTYFAKKAVQYLEKELDTRIELERLKVEFFNTLVLEELYIEDQKADTLAYLQKLELDIYLINRSQKSVDLSVFLYKPVFKIKKEANDETYNLDFLLNYFNSEDSQSSESWTITLNQVQVFEGAFSMHNFHYPDTSYGINYNHIDVSKLNLQAESVEIDGMNIEAQVDSLNLIESCGFTLSNLNTDFKMSEEVLEFSDLALHTPETDLFGYLKLTANSFEDYSEFVELVHLSADFKKTQLQTKDLSYFVPSLQHLNEEVKLEGKLRGTVSNLEAENVLLELNSQTYLNGDFKVRGLPDIKETFIYLNVNEFATTAKGLRALPFPPFDKNRSLDIPDNVDQLGIISFSGNFTGYYYDFVAYGNFNTQLGSISTDLALTENDNGDFAYNGKVSSKSFDFGAFFQHEALGSLGLNVDLNGEGLEKETINAKAKGKISKLQYANYTYSDVNIDGSFTNQTFKGKLNMNDSNLVMAFDGELTNKNEVTKADFELAVAKCNLVKLGLVKREDSLTTIAFQADMDLQYEGIDNFKGSVQLDSISYQDQNYTLANKELKLTALNSGSKRVIGLSSSFLNAELRGKISFENFQEDLKSYVAHYIPDVETNNVDQSSQDFEFEAKVKNAQTIADILVPGLVLDTGIQINARMNSASQLAYLKMQGNHLAYNGQKLDEFNFEIEGDFDSLKQRLKANRMTVGEVNYLDTTTLYSSIYQGKMINQLHWHSTSEILGEGKLDLNTQIKSFDEAEVHFDESYLSIKDSIWDFSDNNLIHIHQDTIRFSDFEISNQIQSVKVQGALSPDENDSLRIELNQLKLQYVSLMLPEDVAKMKGVAKGNIYIKNAYKDLFLFSNLTISDFELNKVPIGNTAFKSIWSPKKEALEIDGYFGKGANEKLAVKGNYYPKRQSNSLDVNLHMNQFPIAVLQPYLIDYLSNLEGVIEGDIAVTGEPSQPLLEGDLQMQNTGITVNYLNTHYVINDKVKIRPDFIGFDLIKITDKNGKDAIATGTIFHNNYSDFNLDVGLEFENFTALNTQSKDNELFYGSAVSSGTANISGFADQLIININATAEKGTEFNIPLADGVDVASSEFLVFTNSPKEEEKLKGEVDLSGIQMNFELDIKEEAIVRIIFDEQIGDVLEAQGIGNLQLEINTLGSFSIYGQYAIEQGEYLFTLKNVISKKFKLAKGSLISWSGDPYRAKIDMNAIYSLRAPLADLMPEDTVSTFKRRSPVELELHMTNYLLSPDVSFDIELPNADESVKQRLRSILYVNQNDVNEQEMNQQVFGLLFLNRFVPPSSSSGGSATTGATGINNGYEMLSNQMSNWLSRISDQFDVGVNYRQGNQYTSDEFDFSLSTELFSDRLVLDGNLGYSNNNQIADNNQANFVGEFTVEYKLSKDGRLRVSGFNRSVNNNLLQTVSPYTQGVGLFYREEFDTFNELWRRYFGKDSKATKEED